MEDIRKYRLLEELYEKYGFIEENISKFREIVFHSVSINKVSYEDILKEGKKNIIKYIVEEIEDGEFTKLFDKAVDKLSISKAFSIFDTILNESNTEISPEDLESISTNEKYKDYYDQIINKYKGSIDNGDYSPIKEDLLREVIETVVTFSNEEEEDLTPTVAYMETLITDDIYGDYLRDISKYKVLTREEEQYLFRRYKLGDESAKDILIKHNLRLAARVARQKMNPYTKLSIMDYIQEANLGLIKAIERYDLTKKTKFSTYGVWWIKQSVDRSMGDKDNEVRVPIHMYEKVRRLSVFEGKYKTDHGEDPTDEMIMKELNVDRNTLLRIREASKFRELDSIDRPIDGGSGDKDTALHEFIADDDNTSPEKQAIQSSMKDELYHLMQKKLTPRDQKILELRFGIKDGRIWTLEEVGKEIGLTRERIRQIESKSLRILRQEAKLETSEDARKALAYKQAKDESIAQKEAKIAERELFNNYRNIIKNESKSKIEVLTIDKDCKKVVAKCKSCNTKWNTTYKFLLNNCYCPECYERKIESEKLGLKELIIDASKWELLKNDGNTVYLKCKECGSTIGIGDKLEKSNPRCAACEKKEKQRAYKEEIQSQLDAVSSMKIEVLKFSKQEAHVKCRECGYEWKNYATKIIDQPFCPRCQKKKIPKWDSSIIKTFLSNKTNGTVEIIKEEKDIYKLKCNRCSSEWDVTKKQISASGSVCQKCKQKGNENSFTSKIRELSNGKLEVSGYTKMTGRVSVKCLDCGEEWTTVARELQIRCFCPKCDKEKMQRPVVNKTIYELVGYPKEIVDKELESFNIYEQTIARKKGITRLTKKESMDTQKLVNKLKSRLKTKEKNGEITIVNPDEEIKEILSKKYRELLALVVNDKRLIEQINSMDLVMASLRFGLLKSSEYKPLDYIAELYGIKEYEVEKKTDYTLNVICMFLNDLVSDKQFQNNPDKDIKGRLARNYKDLITTIITEMNAYKINVKDLVITSLRFGLRTKMKPKSIKEIAINYNFNEEEVERISNETLDKLQEYIIEKINKKEEEKVHTKLDDLDNK